jgi:hypothetical protein
MLPNLIIIGAMKCGTTSLRYYLNQHPDIAMAPDVLNFFVAERNWNRGRAWYEAQFSGPERIHGDCSPRYTTHPIHRDVAERMAALVPDAKLLYLVRDPIERLVSHYLHNLAEGRESRAFDAVLRELDGGEYVLRGHYAAQLERFLPYYERSLLVVFNEDLRQRRLPTLRRIFEFLGVDPAFDSPEFSVERHRTAKKFRVPMARPVLAAPQRAALQALFRPDVERLATLTGRDLRAWCQPTAEGT